MWNEISRKKTREGEKQKHTTNLFVCHCFEAFETETERVRKEEFERRLSKYLVGWLVRPLLWQHLVNFSSTIFTFIRISGCCYRFGWFLLFRFLCVSFIPFDRWCRREKKFPSHKSTHWANMLMCVWNVNIEWVVPSN